MNASTRLLRLVAIGSVSLVSGQLFAITVASTHQVHLDARTVQTTQTISKELLERVPGPRGGNFDWLKGIAPVSPGDVSNLGGGTTIRGIDTTSGMRIIVDGIQFNFTPKVAEGGTSIGINIVPMSAVEGVQVAPYKSTVTVPTDYSLLIGYLHSGTNKLLLVTPSITQAPSSPSTQVVTAPSTSYSYSKWEFGAAYNYMSADEEVVTDLHGFNVAGYYNFTRNVALGVQFGGYYGSARWGDQEMFIDRYSFLAGPRIQCGHEGPVRPFGQVLLGAVHDNVGVEFGGNYYSTSNTTFGMSIGGGINFEVTSHLTLTPSIDWFPTFFGPVGQHQNNWRIGFGAAWRF